MGPLTTVLPHGWRPLRSPAGLLSTAPSPWGAGSGVRTRFAPSLVLSGKAGGRAGCRAGIEASRRAHLFPELEQTGSTRGRPPEVCAQRAAKGSGESGLAATLLGFLALPRAGCCRAPGSSTSRTHSRRSRDLDSSSASARKDVQVRRGAGGTASQGCTGCLSCPPSLRGPAGQHAAPHTWGEAGFGGVSTPPLSV